MYTVVVGRAYTFQSHVQKDYDALAQSVGDRLFFAGEATARKYPGQFTVLFYQANAKRNALPASQVLNNKT